MSSLPRLLAVSLLTSLGLSLGLSLGSAAALAAPDRERNKKAPVVAIFPFKVLNKEDKHQHLGEGAAEAIVNKIVNDKALRIVEESQLDKAINSIARNQTGLFEEDSYLAVGQMVDARYIVIGSVQVAGEQVALNGRLLEVETRQLLAAERVVKPFNDVLGGYDELAARLLSKMTFHLAQRVAGGDSADEIAVRSLIEEAKSFDPMFPPGTDAAGRPLAKDPAKSMALYNKAVLRDPKNGVAQLALGHTQSRASAELEPKDPTRSKNLLKDAIEHLRSATKIDGSNAFAWTELGRCEGRMGNHAQAKVAFQRAIDVDNNYAAARFGLAVAHLNLRELSEARAEALRAQQAGDARAAGLLQSIEEAIAAQKSKPNPTK